MATLQVHELDPDGSDPVMHLTVRAGLFAPAMARAFIRSAVELLGSQAPDDAVLLTSEAVTNSVVHARTEAVEVSLRRHGGSVRVVVSDDDPEGPQMQPEDPDRIGGFGVRLIDMLADEWGVEVDGGDGKHVWFEVALPGQTV